MKIIEILHLTFIFYNIVEAKRARTKGCWLLVTGQVGVSNDFPARSGGILPYATENINDVEYNDTKHLVGKKLDDRGRLVGIRYTDLRDIWGNMWFWNHFQYNKSAYGHPCANGPIVFPYYREVNNELLDEPTGYVIRVTENEGMLALRDREAAFSYISDQIDSNPPFEGSKGKRSMDCAVMVGGKNEIAHNRIYAVIDNHRTVPDYYENKTFLYAMNIHDSRLKLDGYITFIRPVGNTFIFSSELSPPYYYYDRKYEHGCSKLDIERFVYRRTVAINPNMPVYGYEQGRKLHHNPIAGRIYKLRPEQVNNAFNDANSLQRLIEESNRKFKIKRNEGCYLLEVNDEVILFSEIYGTDEFDEEYTEHTVLKPVDLIDGKFIQRRFTNALLTIEKKTIDGLEKYWLTSMTGDYKKYYDLESLHSCADGNTVIPYYTREGEYAGIFLRISQFQAKRIAERWNAGIPILENYLSEMIRAFYNRDATENLRTNDDCLIVIDSPLFNRFKIYGAIDNEINSYYSYYHVYYMIEKSLVGDLFVDKVNGEYVTLDTKVNITAYWFKINANVFNMVREIYYYTPFQPEYSPCNPSRYVIPIYAIGSVGVQAEGYKVDADTAKRLLANEISLDDIKPY